MILRKYKIVDNGKKNCKKKKKKAWHALGLMATRPKHLGCTHPARDIKKKLKKKKAMDDTMPAKPPIAWQ